MRAIVFDQPGDESVLRLGEVPSPQLGPSDLRLAVHTTSVNRADLLQRRGLYPPPPGASTVLGLEAAGEVMEVGAQVSGWRVGDRVMALLPGGGYAEEVVVDAGSVLPIPSGMTYEEAGGVPEVFLTAYLNLFQLAQLRTGETVLIHGGSSGVGTAAIQLACHAGARAIVTVRDARKAESCRLLGAESIIYTREDFVARLAELTSGRRADVVLDCVGGLYLDRNLRSLAIGGRLICIGTLSGSRAELDLALALSRRITLIGSTLRSRPVAEKAALVRGFLENKWPLFESGSLRPIVDQVLPLAAAATAHRVVASSVHVGKVILKIR